MRPAGAPPSPPREFVPVRGARPRAGGSGTWATTRDAVNSVWYQSADQLVARSRDIARKDGWAAKAIDEWVCNAIGNGIKPQSLHPDQATKEKIQKLWSQFANECDAAGVTDFYGLEALAFRSMVEGGECFVRKHLRTMDWGLTVPLQLQLMEAEQLPFYLARPTPETPQGNVVRASIEFDPDGRRTAYYFYKEHPGERLFFPNYLDLLRIPAAEVMHLFRPMRPGQLRGIPWLANALVRLWELDQYDDAELLRKKFAAMMMAFIIRQNPEDPFFGNEQTTGAGHGCRRRHAGCRGRCPGGATRSRDDDGSRTRRGREVHRSGRRGRQLRGVRTPDVAADRRGLGHAVRHADRRPVADEL